LRFGFHYHYAESNTLACQLFHIPYLACCG
jgi:hypothetical protein